MHERPQLFCDRLLRILGFAVSCLINLGARQPRMLSLTHLPDKRIMPLIGRCFHPADGYLMTEEFLSFSGSIESGEIHHEEILDCSRRYRLDVWSRSVCAGRRHRREGPG